LSLKNLNARIWLIMKTLSLCIAVLISVLVNPGFAREALELQPGYVLGEFIYEQAPFPQCHASTIAQNSQGTLVAAWFGGTREKSPDVGIWVSRKIHGKWSNPVEVANGVINEEKRHPTWNPVLFQQPNGLVLYYKVGPSPRTWWGEYKTSKNGGMTWSKATRLPDGIFGPIKNKPIALKDGTILSGSSTEHDGWRVHMERSSDNGATWSATKALNTKEEMGVIQPTIVKFGDRLQMLCRSRQGKIAVSSSADDGKTWSKFSLTNLPNPNSGIDAVTLADGRALVVYNHTPRGRSPLNVGVSSDGKTWKQVITLENEPGEYSYPAIIQTKDGKVHITYTWRRQRVKHVVLDPAKLK
jgi:predicted neuraminidase